MDRRYDNYDVRTDKRLRPLAYEFLKQYKGDFSFLNECRRFLNDRGYLGDSHVRGVLNSMLADPTVTNMPVPIKTVFDARDKSLAVEFTEPVETASLDTRKVELPGVHPADALAIRDGRQQPQEVVRHSPCRSQEIAR
jgi:hypothetical protein